MAKDVKRSYDSTGRSRQAQENHDRISRVAHDLFVEHGYGNTTIADVAQAAGVSQETVYKAFGNKTTLLRRAWFVTMRGDGGDETLYDRPETQEVLQLPDLADRIDGFARLTTERNRLIGPLLRAVEGAAEVESGAREMLDTWKARLIDVATKFAHAAAETEQLAIPQDECRDITYAMLDGALWHRFVLERGWTDERYADWLSAQWRRQFVRKPAPSSALD
jgi:AcrR family transcriptional regulator